jgi:hypothetical protein
MPAKQVLRLSVVLAGQNPAGLASEVAAISTPGSASYRHYLTSAQFTSRFGPTVAQVAQVTSALRAEGLTVGAAAAGSMVLPVSGTASVVSAALDTPLESVRLPSHTVSFVNTAEPQLPAAVAGDVTAIAGLNGLASPQSMLREQPRGSSAPIPATPTGGAATPAAPSGAAAPGSHAEVAHSDGPQACAGATSSAAGGSYTSTQLASVYGLNQLFSQGRTGIGESIGIVEFEQYSSSDIAAFQSCYGLTNAVHSVVVDGPVGGPAAGSGEAALDIELAAVNAPSASIIVYEAPNEVSDAASIDLLNRIASDDVAQVVTTSWGICENLNSPGDAAGENTIFERMAAQGQTMVAAAGDTGSEDCYDTNGSTALAVDDPGSQPDVLDTGGTSLTNSNVAQQSVWNNCQGEALATGCQLIDEFPSHGAGGGGYSDVWTRPNWQPAVTSAQNGREVPDLSASADPDHGVAAVYGGAWHIFGGTSAVAPATAAFLADSNQGCTNTLGLVSPTLYAVDSGSTFTDVASGNNDFTGSNGGDYAATTGYDLATGLGSPQDQNLSPALQGNDGCPSVAALSLQTGPVTGAGAITIAGGGLADVSSVSFGSGGTGQIISESETSMTVVPPSPGRSLCVDVTVTNPDGTSAISPGSQFGFGSLGNCDGYRFVAADGGIFDFGNAAFEGSTGNIALSAPIVGMATTPDGGGYWLVASDGGVFSFGDAQFYGSAGNIHLNEPIVGMAATPDGNGYWLVASDGGIFSFGAAKFLGSTGAIHLNKPIVGMTTTGDGGGYWLVASDGGVFSFGDAQYYGSTGDLTLTAPIVGMAATPNGNGYWLVASDGGIFGFGGANYDGSMGGQPLNKPIVGMATTPDGGGYWLVASDGGIFSFGDAQFYGSTGAIHLNKPIVGMSAG